MENQSPQIVSAPSHSHEHWMRIAASVALNANCERAKCGSVIVARGEIIGRGYNSPTGDYESQRMCNRAFPTPAKPKSDRTCCMHAEWRAMIEALKSQPQLLSQSILYFTRVDDRGEIQFSGDPYCTVCSRFALDIGIPYFALWHREGIKIYDTKEYNLLSYQYGIEKHASGA